MGGASTGEPFSIVLVEGNYIIVALDHNNIPNKLKLSVIKEDAEYEVYDLTEMGMNSFTKEEETVLELDEVTTAIIQYTLLRKPVLFKAMYEDAEISFVPIVVGEFYENTLDNVCCRAFYNGLIN